MGSNERMISSLPLLHEADIDIEQTKLALDILRKISVSMLNTGSGSGSSSPAVSGKQRNKTYFKHTFETNTDNNADGNNTKSEVTVDQINMPGQIGNANVLVESRIQNHEEMLTASDDENYCPQYYNSSSKYGHHHLHHHRQSFLHHHHHRANSPTATQQLLYRSLSSPIAGHPSSSPDSILAYLTAEEGHSSASSATSSTTALSSDDEHHFNHHKKHGSSSSRRGRTLSLFYDSTTSESSVSSLASSVKSHKVRPEQGTYLKDSTEVKSAKSGLNCAEDKLKDNMNLENLDHKHKDDDDEMFHSSKNKEDSPSVASSTSSFYYSAPCSCNEKVTTTSSPGSTSRHRHQSEEGEIKCLRDQLEIEKLVCESNLQSLNPLSSSSSSNESKVNPTDGHPADKIDDNEDVQIPCECLLSLHDFQESFVGLHLEGSSSTDERKRHLNVIRVMNLQKLFNCFKIAKMPTRFGKDLLFALESTQRRDDFQWVLHQMGGFHALLILYARVVEISSSDWLQSQGLNLVLNQLRNYGKLTDPPLPKQYHLLRYLLNSENSTFQYQTYKVLMSHCLNPSGQRIQDYNLLLICIMESWRTLIGTKCTIPEDEDELTTEKAQAPNGPITLLECFLTTMNSLCIESNSQRDINIGILKENGFAESLLALCKGVVYCVTEEQDTCPTNHGNKCSHLTIDDGLKIAKLVKSLLNELMAPPDGYISATLIQFGLLPFLPNELPPLPIKENSFFVYPKHDENSDLDLFATSSSSSSSRSSISTNEEYSRFDVSYADEAKEFYHDEFSSDEDNTDATEKLAHNLKPSKLLVPAGNERKSSVLSLNLVNSPASEFLTIFQETLIEGFMTILLNSVAILPDSIFHSVLNQKHILSYHILLAYCSHSNVNIKILALKLISTYLSRVKTNVLSDFLKNRGFFLASLYIQSCSKLAPLVVNICHGFGPVSYSMMVGLIYSPTVVTKLIDWMKEDPVSVAPALLSVGIFPSIIHYYKSTTKFSSQLNRLLTHITKYVVLNSRNEPWSILFCPGIESSTKSSLLCSKLVRDAIEILRNSSHTTQIKKTEASNRLLWLIENGVNGRYGSTFEKWLFKLLLNHILDSTIGVGSPGEYNELWKYFVKKHNKKLYYFLGLFLCNVFAPNRIDNNNIYYNFQQSVLREILASVSIANSLSGNSSSSNTNWLVKVVKSDEQIMHCFKTFIKIYFMENEANPKLYMRQQSFQSLTPLLNSPITRQRRCSENSNQDSTVDLDTLNTIFHLSDRSINLKFQNLLINLGILTPDSLTGPVTPSNNTQHSSKLSNTSFKTLNILLDNPSLGQPTIENYNGYGGVPYHELRKCLQVIEKLRTQQQRKSSKASIISSTFKRNNNLKETSGRSGSRSRNSSGGSSSAESNTPVPFHLSNSKCYFDSVFETVNNCALDVIDVCTKLRARQEMEIARRLSIREVDIFARQRWWSIRQNMTHPKAPWFFKEIYPTFWALDQSEGPGRIRIRLRKSPLRVANKFLLPDYRKQEIRTYPLQYLFYSSSEEFMGYAGVQSDIKFIRSCLRIVPGEELSGEIIITDTSLHFIPEICNRFNWDRIDVMKSSIFQILRRRYALEDRGLELFVGSRCFLFVFKTQMDREQFIQVLAPAKNSMTVIALNTAASQLCSLVHQNSSPTTNSELLNATLTTMTTQWIKGNLSNFDYLMHLNTAAGRTHCDLMQYPVFPFVLSKYNGSTIDLNSSSCYRDLRKPMAIQDPSKEEHFMSTYNYLKREGDSAPFHYGSHYSNSGIVLHFLVRLPPYTQHFLKYQDGNFDIPDRSFHSVETAWRLASKDSNTDFKEMIPEFFYLPEFLLNLQHFDLGIRQNGTRVDDVLLPEWSHGDARIFTLINRQALESSHTRKHLSDWIDLIFGYKQTGTFAVQALNCFHPSTYEGFEVDGDGTDELIKRARKAMVSTYGQTPKKLFGFPHPRAQEVQPSEGDNVPQVLENVTGLKWGKLLGSPASPGFEVINTREFNNEPNIELFETVSRVVFWPERTLILGDAVVGSWDASGIRVKSNILYLCIADEITTVCGVETSIWIGHESGKITVLKLSTNLTKVLETRDLIGHYNAIKCIDLNNEFSTAFSCSGHNYIIAWDMNTVTFCNVIEHSESIDSVYSSRSTGDVLLLNRESNTVTFTTINGFVIGKIEHTEKIESVCISNVDPGRNVNLIAVGCDYGIIRFYSSWDLKFLSQIKVNNLSTLPIKSIRYSKDGRRLYCLSQTDTNSLTVALQMTPSRKGSS